METCETQATTANSRSMREFGCKNAIRFLVTPKITTMQKVGDNVEPLWLTIFMSFGPVQNSVILEGGGIRD